MRVIGKFREIYNDNTLPSLKDNIAKHPYKNQNKIVDFLKKGVVSSIAPAKPVDIVTTKTIDIDLMCMKYNDIGWRSDLIYYIEKYNVKLSEADEKIILECIGF